MAKTASVCIPPCGGSATPLPIVAGPCMGCTVPLPLPLPVN